MKACVAFARSNDLLVFSAKRKRRKEYRYRGYVPSESVSWMAYEIRSRSYYARPPTMPGCSRPICIVGTYLCWFSGRAAARSSRLVTPITLSSRANRGCRWFFDGMTFCKLRALVKRTLRSVIRTRRRRCPIAVHHSLYLEPDECLLQQAREQRKYATS